MTDLLHMARPSVVGHLASQTPSQNYRHTSLVMEELMIRYPQVLALPVLYLKRVTVPSLWTEALLTHQQLSPSSESCSLFTLCLNLRLSSEVFSRHFTQVSA